ncbi:MAG: 50S ribosomal protein L21 [Patescibacteria group bacterium]|nr:50S ribosomal protein L21 [Patescibacteria group bacterium]
MAKIAVIKTGGKQYKVAEGQSLNIEKLEKNLGDKVKFETLLIADEKDLQIGKPFLGEKVEGEILEQGRHDKISVVKFKNKTRYTRNRGHRQPFTKVKIISIAQ